MTTDSSMKLGVYSFHDGFPPQPQVIFSVLKRLKLYEVVEDATIVRLFFSPIWNALAGLIYCVKFRNMT